MIEIVKYTGQPADELLRRAGAQAADVADKVRAILEDVRTRGDEAALDYSERFDGVRPQSLLVSEQEMDEALACVDKALLETIRLAAANIERFHLQQKRVGFIDATTDGVVMGQRVLPLKRVGLYVPGGTARYPSSVLMDAIPARIAGVSEIVMTTPPDKADKVPDAILAAARVAGVTKIVKLGGAQAIAALAYGTATVPRVDKIVGPGNVYVNTAKQLVYGQVDIDMIAGPSEILVLADGKSDPENVAADLLSQAEHGELSAAWLVTDSEALAHSVAAELEKQLPLLPREAMARVSIQERGRIIVVDQLAKGVEVANDIAPEHLELCVDEPFALLPLVRNAGSVFLGRSCPESLGDYLAGPNHTLPTGGTARFSSPLGVDDFVKRSSYLYYTDEALRRVGEHVERFALEEGLTAHARAVAVRRAK